MRNPAIKATQVSDPLVTAIRNKEEETICQYTLNITPSRYSVGRTDLILSQILLQTVRAIHPRNRILQNLLEKSNMFLEEP